MSHLERLAESGQDLWRNPSIMGVMVLQYVLFTLLGVLFILIDLAVVASINGEALAPLLTGTAPTEAFVHAIWNAPTIITLSIIIFIQLAILTFIGALFTAGAYGMIRNLLLDGNTTFKEFVPMARRYTGRIFRFTLLRYAIILIPLIILTFAFVGILGTTQGLVSDSQFTFLFGAMGLVAAVALTASLLLLYGDAIIVFEDIDAIPAAKRAVVLVRAHFKTSFAAGVLAVVLVLLFMALLIFVSIPLQPSPETTPTFARVMGTQAVDILGNVLLLAVSLTITIFIFRTYRAVTGGVIRTTPYSRRKKKS